MSSLKGNERLKFERLFRMGDGYVMGFTNNTFSDFVVDITGTNIYDEKYSLKGSSKANRLRAFWEVESDYLVTKLNDELLAYWKETCYEDCIYTSDVELYNQCKAINDQLKKGGHQDELKAIKDASEGQVPQLLLKTIEDAINQNNPELSLDRLHTLTVSYIRSLGKKHRIDYDWDKPLHSIFGEYLRYLKGNKLIESEMAERIMKTSISNLEAFNHVRNHQSFAHDNVALNKNESLYIFKSVANTFEFISCIERELDKQKDTDCSPSIEDDDDLPF